MYVRIHVCMYICSMYVCTVCMHVRMYVCACCTYMYIGVFVCNIHIYMKPKIW